MTVYEVIQTEKQRLMQVRLFVTETDASEAIRTTIMNLQAVLEAFDEEAKKNPSTEEPKEVTEDV